MLSNHFILSHPLLSLPSIFPSIRVFSNKSALCIRWSKYWSFSYSIRPSLPPDTSTTEHHFCFGPATSFFLELLGIAPHSSLVSYLFAFSYCSWGSCGKIIGGISHSFLQWTTFCQNSSLWPICLGWPCPVWFLVSLNSARPFATTRLWPMKGRRWYSTCQKQSQGQSPQGQTMAPSLTNLVALEKPSWLF